MTGPTSSVVLAMLLTIVGCRAPERPPRTVATLAAHGGVSSIGAPVDERSKYGEADYRMLGGSARVGWDGPFGRGFAVTATTMHGDLIRVTPAYETDGFVHPKFMGTAVSGVFGYIRRGFALEAGLSMARFRHPAVERPFRVLPVARVQYLGRSGAGVRVAFLSRDHFLADTNGFSAAFVHRHSHFQFVAGAGVGVRTLPMLSSREAVADELYVGGLRGYWADWRLHGELTIRLAAVASLVVGLEGGAQPLLGTLGLRFTGEVEERDVIDAW